MSHGVLGHRWSLAAYGTIGFALGLILVLGVWGAYRDIELMRNGALQLEIDRLRGHAIRAVGRIERALDDDEARQLQSLGESDWLPQMWQSALASEQQQLLAAVVEDSGEIVLHSDASLQGNALPPGWTRRPLNELEGNIVEARTGTLDADAPAYVLEMPIRLGGEQVGSYFVGLDAEAFQQWLSTSRNAILRQWGVIIAGAALIVLLAAGSLYYLASRSLALDRRISQSELARAAELGQLAAGLAHEIRNPLHAIRLNLHALARSLEGRASLESGDVATICEQSNQEIDRVDRLLKELLGFASPETARNEDLDVRDEARATLDFLRLEMQQKKIELSLQMDERPALVHLDRGRLRQVLLNLLMNARDAVQPGGKIEVQIARQDGAVALDVADDGPGIGESDRRRIFEPFYSKKEGGSGLGLPLVKRFVEQAHGRIECQANLPRGTRFHLLFPEAPSKSRSQV